MRCTGKNSQAGSKQEKQREESGSTHIDRLNKRSKLRARAIRQEYSQLFLYINKYPPHWNLQDQVSTHHM